MALSGSNTTTFGGGHHELRLRWTATQDEVNNKSTITAKLYHYSDSGYSLYKSNAGSGQETIMGQQGTFSATISTSGGKETLLGTVTKTITHNADGTLSGTISGSFPFNVTLSGSYVGTVSVSMTATLDTIPQSSDLTSSKSWTAGGTLGVTIDRNSTDFNHVLTIEVLDNSSIYRLIATETFTTSQTSRTVTFTEDENFNLYTYLAGRSSMTSRLVLTTKSGSTVIGSKTYTGTVTAPAASTLNLAASFDIGGIISGGIIRSNANFVHNISLYKDDGTTGLATMQIDATTAFSYDSTPIKTSLFNLTPNSNTLAVKIGVLTRFKHSNGSYVTIRSEVKISASLLVKNSNPTFSAVPTYADTTQSAVTGDNQYIIQNKSSLSVTIPLAGKATAINGATMISYEVVLNNKSVSGNYSATANVVIAFGALDSPTDVNLTVNAVDSRGNKTAVNLTVKVFPYSNPTINFSLARVNSFEDLTDILATGAVSPLLVNGVKKNALQTFQYRWRERVTGTQNPFGAWVNMSNVLNNDGSYSGSAQQTLINTSSFDFEVQLYDKFGSITASAILASGQPIFFMDTLLRSIGFNDFPNEANQMLINGKLKIGSNQWLAAGGYGINMNNSDMIGCNGFYFNDKADGNYNGEGLNFFRSDTPVGSIDPLWYDSLYVRDGVLYLNEERIGLDARNSLWSGSAYPTETATITPSLALSKCPNGWILLWSDYDVGGSFNNTDFVFTVIHKEFAQLYNNQYTLHLIPSIQGSAKDLAVTKRLLVTDSTLVGHTLNYASTGGVDGATDRRDVVLREVLPF